MAGLIGVEDGQAPKYLKRFIGILFLATVISLAVEGGGYFIFLRWLYFTTLIYCFGLNLVLERPLIALLSIGMAILYNPFWPIWLQERELWLGIDTAIIIAIYLFAKNLKSNFFGDVSFSPQFAATKEDSVLDLDENLFQIANGEIENNRQQKELWTKAFAIADGDENKQKAVYLRLRAQELKDSMQHVRESDPHEWGSEATRLKFQSAVQRTKRKHAKNLSGNIETPSQSKSTSNKSGLVGVGVVLIMIVVFLIVLPDRNSQPTISNQTNSRSSNPHQESIAPKEKNWDEEQKSSAQQNRLATIQSSNWQPIFMGSDRIVYADKTNAHQSAGLVSAWILIDHQTIQEEVGDRYLSSKGQYEINCHQRTLRQIYHELFSGNMGSGGIVWSGALGRDFVPAEAGTIGRSLVNYYCS